MFKNWLRCQTPFWLIVPVLVVGVILDYRLAHQKARLPTQTVAPSDSDDRVNPGDRWDLVRE